MTRKFPVWLIPLLSILTFGLTGLALIPYPGLQNDELFFAGPIYADLAFYKLQFGAAKVPLMVMSYTGALKTWLYMALFQVLAPDEWSVRVPVLLMGMATVWLSWVLVRRLAGDRAANVTAILLATDTIFLMTNTFDWGPVALQHILLMAGLVAIQSWVAGGSRRMLALGFFLWGLGAWDKALMAWPLIGLAVATVVVYPRELKARLRLKPLGLAVLAFLIGASPLVWFNLDRAGETATANTRFTAEGLGTKLRAAEDTVNGSTLFGYMVYTSAPAAGHAQGTILGKVAARIGRVFGNHRKNGMIPAYALGLICFVICLRSPRRRILLFLLITTAVAWAQMALTKGTGGASHHVILLWPFPVMFLGIALSEAAARARYGAAALIAVTVILAGTNLLTTNEYLREFDANGGFGGWTDAIYRLAGSVEKGPSVSWIGLVDWGYLNALETFHEGDLPLFIVADGNRAEIKREIEAPESIFIQHTEDKQMFPGINDRLRDMAGQLGFEEHVERTVHDRNGRPVFELFRFVKPAR